MGALLDRFRAAGVAFVALPDGSLRALGPLTEPIRATIRTEKAAILAELAANDCATPEQAAELRELVAVVAADWPEAERREALAVALADPASALTCLRALAENLRPAPPVQRMDSGMRTCNQCRNFTPSGRCMAAARRESFGVGVYVNPRYRPDPGVPQRCGPFVPLPGDPDQRTGADRWPFLYDVPSRRNGGPRG